MTGIFSNIANTLNLGNLLPGQQAVPPGFVGPVQPSVQGSQPSIGSQVTDNYTKIANQPGFSNALFKLGATLLSARENGIGLGQGLVAGQQAYNSEIDRAQAQQAALAQAQLERAKFLTDTGFKTNTANLEQQKFGLEQQKFAANPGAPAEIQAAQQIMAANPGMSFTDAYLTAKNGMIMGGTPGAAGAAAGVAAGAPGDFLSTLPASQASQVKALAEGRMSFPSGFALRTPYWQQMLSLVSQYDPNFDAVNYNARSATRKAFTSGASAQTINNLNTALGHLDELQKAADKLSNADMKIPGVTLYNSLANYVSAASGEDPTTNFNTVKNRVIPEISAAYVKGGGTAKERGTNAEDFSSSMTPTQMKGALGETAQLLASKIQALSDQYHQGMGTSVEAKNFLQPKSLKVLKNLGVDIPGLGSFNGNQDAVQNTPNALPQGNTPPALTPQEAIAVLRNRGHKL